MKNKEYIDAQNLITLRNMMMLMSSMDFWNSDHRLLLEDLKDKLFRTEMVLCGTVLIEDLPELG